MNGELKTISESAADVVLLAQIYRQNDLVQFSMQKTYNINYTIIDKKNRRVVSGANAYGGKLLRCAVLPFVRFYINKNSSTVDHMYADPSKLSEYNV